MVVMVMVMVKGGKGENRFKNWTKNCSIFFCFVLFCFDFDDDDDDDGHSSERNNKTKKNRTFLFPSLAEHITIIIIIMRSWTHIWRMMLVQMFVVVVVVVCFFSISKRIHLSSFYWKSMDLIISIFFTLSAKRF